MAQTIASKTFFNTKPQNHALPKTEGVKYAGSKLKLLAPILNLTANLRVSKVHDGFSGTTRVSQAFAQKGFEVISSDISPWSEVFACCYLKNKHQPSYYKDLLAHLNSLEGRMGWFSKHYGGQDIEGFSKGEDGKKKPWQMHNTLKLDAIREEIDNMHLSEVDRAVALTSLILALDQVDNSLGHHCSYLNKWSARSYKKLFLKIPALFPNTKNHQVLQGDIFDILDKVQAELTYLDPPYGSNNTKMPASRVRYGSYYHLWTSVIKNDKPPLFGQALRRCDTSDKQACSVFEDFRQDSQGKYVATQAIDKLIKKTKSPYIIFSYNSNGRAGLEDILDIINKHGRLLQVVSQDYKKHVMSSMKWTLEWSKNEQNSNKEFIFLMEK